VFSTDGWTGWRRSVRRVWLILALLLPTPLAGQTATTMPSAAPASPLDGKVVREIVIVGLEQIDEAYVRNQIRSRENQPYLQAEVQRDVGRLLRTGRFLDVRAEPALVDEQVSLTLRLKEKPAVRAIEFIGAREFETKKLTEELVFAVGDPLDLFEVRQGREAIERKYKEEGYAYIEVSFDEDLLTREQRVVYTIVENQRVRVREIVFDGNTAYSDGELGAEIETKQYIWIFRKGDFDPDRAERDAAKIQKYYRDRGYLDAEASYVTEFKDVAREKLRMFFRINEGTRYVVRDVLLDGNTVFGTDELLAEMKTMQWSYLIDARLQSDVKRLATKYGKIGYIYSTIAPSWVFADEPGQIVLTLKIDEGQQYRVGWIEVNGNYRTQEKCVRRELDFYPEQIVDSTKLEKAEKELKATGLFSEAIIEPVGSEPDVRDILVTVDENVNTNQFIFGIGASSDSGAVGNIVLENTNFDLMDWPRGWKEFVQGKSFRGAGQSMKLQFEPGTEYTRFRIDFREPYLMDKEIGFGTSLYLFERGRDGYDEERVGGNVSFGKAFEDGRLEGWAGEVAFRMEVIDVGDVESFAAKDIRDDEGSNYLSSIKLSLLHDTTDDRTLPGEGHRFRMSWEQTGFMGGDFTYAKLTGSYSRHYTVNEDEEGRKSIVSLRARVGQMLGESPVFERFYAGGIGSFRGFDYRGISPRDGLRKNRIGGEFMLLTGAEYSFPLYGKLMRGVLFTDMGTVEEDFGINSWRASVGAGVRLTLDVFGGIPMEFDFAIPASSNSEDDERVFSFFIGLPFF